MQRWRALGAALGAVALVAACGGKVAVDSGGAGGSASASTGTGTATTSSGCVGLDCKEGNATCTCVGTCSDQALEVDCIAGDCTCIENGIKIFNCTDSGSVACHPVEGCCAQAFFGGGG